MKRLAWFAPAIVVAFVVSVASCGRDPCGPDTCSGCCNSNGICVPGDIGRACGAGGIECSVCRSNQLCEAATCVTLDGGAPRDAGFDAGRTDFTAPETAILTGPPNPAGFGAAATFTFNSNEPGIFECAVDDGGYVTCSSPRVYPGLAAGNHSFSVRAIDNAGNVDSTPATRAWRISAGSVPVRIVSANLTSGPNQSWEEREGAYDGPGIRILRGLQPHVVLIQEWRFRTSSAPGDFNDFVSNVFDAGYAWCREPTTGDTGTILIPNGIISRWPIAECGEWPDSTVLGLTRDYAYARIDLPGPTDLWAVSVHLSANDAAARVAQVNELVGFIQTNVPANAYLVVGGDLNTDDRSDPVLDGGAAGQKAFVAVVGIGPPYPIDQAGNPNTNSSRQRPFDWVMVDADLQQHRVPTVISSLFHSEGHVFDTRVYLALGTALPPPVRGDDSCPFTPTCGSGTATNMQHMAVIRDFLLPLDGADGGAADAGVADAGVDSGVDAGVSDAGLDGGADAGDGG